MAVNEMVSLSRDCKVSIIPSGETMILATGTQVWITQALGGSYTVMTGTGHMVRIDNRDADAIGKEVTPPSGSTKGAAEGSLEKMVWEQLKTCYDPEIPVNIVDLGLVYKCEATPLADAAAGNKVDVRFTLTAPGCGMGDVLKDDIALNHAVLDLKDQFKVMPFKKVEHPTADQVAENKKKWGVDPNS